MPDLLELARAYVRAGLSVIPVKADGSKSPAVLSWKQFQARRPTDEELSRWFAGADGAVGIAVICGGVSGNLTVIDFDDAVTFDRWAVEVERDRPGWLQRFALARTPSGGAHLYFRGERVVGNRKLASDPQRPDHPTLIETRGFGGYVLAPGCPPGCHPKGAEGKVYEWERTADLFAG
jgi:hypothetical protein